MAFRVVLAPEAQAQLLALYEYVAAASSPRTAQRFTDALLKRCEGLSQLPSRGAPRDDIRPGLRILSHKGQATVAYDVEAETVTVLGVFYAGQDYEAALGED